MARSNNRHNGFLHRLFNNETRELKRDVRLQVKYYIRNNKRSVDLIKRAYRKTGILIHSLLPSLQDKIILDLRKKRMYDEITNQELKGYIETEVRKNFK